MKKTNILSSPAFWNGVSTLFTFGNNTLKKYVIAKNPEQADYDALASDWKAIGEDLYEAMNIYEQQKK